MKQRKRIHPALFVGLVVASWLAATVPTLPAQTVYAIQGGKVFTLAGPPIENATVVIRNGKIAAVGANVSIPRGARVIDAAGLEVYPGLFDSLSRLGLTEIGSVSATSDTTELGDYNPQLFAATAIHPAGQHIPVTRANGITHVVSAPGSGGTGLRASSPLIPGQASLIHLDGWTIEEMLIRKSVGLILNWPTMSTGPVRRGGGGPRPRPFSEVKKDYEKKVAELEEWIEAARHYAQAEATASRDNFERDLKLEALVPFVSGEQPVILVANKARAIKNGLEFAEKHQLKVILAGGAEAWKVKDLLKEKNVPVILRPTQTVPGQEDEPYDKPFTNPGELHAAGIKIAFATFDSSSARVLPYEAANAVGYGLPREEALRAVTLYPAQILGVDDQLGTIEVGKTANLIVTDGDPLEIQTQVRHLFINGRLTSTDNKHRQLWEKYRNRP